MQSEPSSDITRTVVLVLVIGGLLVGSGWTLLPFLNGLLWGTTIAVATWPTMLRVQQLAGGRRSTAVAIMMVAILLIFIGPFALAIGTLRGAADREPAILSDFFVHGIGPPPDWVAPIPIVGSRVANRWQEISAGGPEAFMAAAEPYGRMAAAWAIGATGSLGRMLVLILLTVLVVAILYSRGETALSGALALARRLGGPAGERTILLAGQAVRSVALGVVVTALIQSVLAGLGLYICGIPHPGLLTALAFVLGIAQLGPTPVLVPAVIWLFWSGSTGWGTVLLVWSVPVGLLDNVLRPILIRRGVQLPLLLIIAGVIGGLISFGVVGLFVGPVILAATYTLAREWVASGESRTSG